MTPITTIAAIDFQSESQSGRSRPFDGRRRRWSNRRLRSAA
jgi:hypothetical protein